MSIGFLTLDILIILVIFIGTFIFSFQAGKKQVVKFLLAVYPALLIFLNLQIDIVDPKIIIGAFIGIYILSYLLLKKNFTSPGEHSGGRRFFDGLLVSIAAVFTLLIIYYKILPIDTLYELKLPFSGFLIEKIPFYITVLIPILLIVITNKRDS